LQVGSSDLIGAESVRYFDQRATRVYGIDNNMRADFFGPEGDTTWNLRQLLATCKRFEHPGAAANGLHHELDQIPNTLSELGDGLRP